MKITFTAEDYKTFEKERREANKGCYICPCCGEYRQSFVYDMLGENLPLRRIGIDIHTERRKIYDPKLDEFTNASIDCFLCNNCHTQWESEPFDFDSNWDEEGEVFYDGDRLDDEDDDDEWIIEIDDD